MVRLKTIRKFKCPIALCGIIVFAVVVGCDLFCDLGLISFSIPQLTVTSSGHSHGDHHDDSHRQGKQHNHGDHDHGVKADHNSQSSDEENCCDDLTQRFYASLTNNTTNNTSPVQVQLFKVLFTLLFEYAPIVINPIDLGHTKVQHLPNGPPGINGQVLRILINSFQI